MHKEGREMTEKKGYTEENAKTIDQWVDDGWIWGDADLSRSL